MVRHQARRYPDLDLLEPDSAGLDPRDAAFAHALYDIVVRRWLTLRHLLARHLDQPWTKLKPEAKATLLVGAAQLLFMRSVPPHAAVSESVEWMAQNASKGGAGLVNAILRKLAAEIAPSEGHASARDAHVASAGVPIVRSAGSDDDTEPTPTPREAVVIPGAEPEYDVESEPASEVESRPRAEVAEEPSDLTSTEETASVEHASAEESHVGAASEIESTAPPVGESRADAATPESPAGWNDRRDALPHDDGTIVGLVDELLPADPLERLAVASSHPAELLAEWIKHAPMEKVRALALHGLAHPPVILNTQHARSPLPEEHLTPHRAPGHHVFKGARAALEKLLAARDDVWVQDPASSLAVQSVIDLKPRLVIDYCAGRGTKTRQLALAFPDARIVATDIDQPRFKYLQRAFADASNVQVVSFNAIRDFVGKADLVLIDAPCSNTGVLARRVEAKYRVDRDRTDGLTAIQRQLIADCIPLLNTDEPAKDGVLPAILYSTCSLDPKENEAQAAWAARWHSFKTSREHRRAPSGGPGKPAEEYSDGSYAVLLS